MFNLLLLCVGVILATWFVGNALGFLLMLMVAGLVGFAAEALIPGRPLYHGWAGAIGAGLIGSWLGSSLVGPVGPILMGVPLLPALIGSMLLVVGLSFLRRPELLGRG